MVPGKKYAPEDYVRIVWRRKWLVVLPLVAAAVGTFLYSRSLPNIYRSEALVLIIPQQVPEKYIRPTIDESITARLDLMRQQILSRAKLEQIIEEFDLYREERKTILMDQVVEQMKRDIGVNVQRVGRRQNPNHFVVSYDSRSPDLAKQVAERVSSLFVRENVEGRSVQTDATIQFLQREADETLRQMKEQERQLAEFKRVNASRLPEGVETSIQLMSNARQQIQSLGDGINRDKERQIALDRMLGEELAAPPAPAAAVTGNPRDAAMPAAQQLAGARAILDGLLLRLKEDHPDVRIARNHIKDLEKKAEAEALQQPLGTVAALTPVDAERQKRVAKLRADLETIDRDIKAKELALARTQAALADQERRVQAAPALMSQMTDLTRGHEGLRSTHEALLKKLQDARLGSSLEQQQVGQQLRIIDPARRPAQPRSPDRVRMNALGASAGLVLGLLFVGLLEYRDTSLRTDDDVLVALSLPVLALVPTMRTSSRRGRWRGLIAGSSVAVVLSVVAAVWKLGLFGMWSR